MDIDDMRYSWLEAVSNGEAEGFSRHFVPDILDEVDRLRAHSAKLSEALGEAVKAMDNIHPCEGWEDQPEADQCPVSELKRALSTVRAIEGVV